ncbi:hypothetical protein [uncultured Methylobacterium sp.]
MIFDTARSGSQSRIEQWEGEEPYALMRVTITNGFVVDESQIGLK